MDSFLDRFDYSEEPSTAWGDRLKDIRHRQIREQSPAGILTHVFWGAHEPLKGMRDFSKASRLRLEKFLKAAQDNGLSVDIVTGFQPAKETFPIWALALEKKTLVPASFWKGEPDGLALTEAPSICDENLNEPFCSFLEELFQILALYRVPEGPVRRVTIDFGLFETDLNLTESEWYVDELRARHKDIKTFNLRFGTAFNAFPAGSFRQSIRHLNDKRPWLSAFDYKWCRRRILQRLEEKIRALESTRPLSDLIHFSSLPGRASAPGNAGWEIALDPVLLETAGQAQISPFAPAGFVNSTATSAFRLGEYLVQKARCSNVGLHMLPLWEKQNLFTSGLVTVVCGKYLTCASARTLKDHVDRGGQAIFPFGAPQYDEDMKCHEWASTTERALVRVGTHACLRQAYGSGWVWTAHPTLEYGDSLWEELIGMAEAIKNEVSP